MSSERSPSETTRAVRFHEYGEPAEVLRLDRLAVAGPPPGRVRVAVHACGLNPADWALCRGLAAGLLPRGIGLEVSGVVDAVGAGVEDVGVGDLVLGTPDWSRGPSAGAADVAILEHWARVPPGLDLVRAAALPMAAETAHRSLDCLGVGPGRLVLIHGAGTTVGFAAVQLARMRGARVVATAGETYAGRLREFGAAVTAYGDGMVERVRDLAAGPPDLILDAAAPGGVLPDLIRIAGGDPGRVLTIADFAAARQLGVRDNGGPLRYDLLGAFARWVAEGRLDVPIARTFALDDWERARQVSEGGHARGKLVLLPGGSAGGV